MSGTATDTIYVKESTGVQVYKTCIIPDWQVEQIAIEVVRKLGGMVTSCGYWDSESRICSLHRPDAEQRSCDRNICTENEYNGVSCDECEIEEVKDGEL